MTETIHRTFEEDAPFRNLVEMILGSLNVEDIPPASQVLIDQIRSTIGETQEERDAYMKGLFMGMVLSDPENMRLDHAVLFVAALIKVVAEEGNVTGEPDPWRSWLNG